MSGKCDVPAEGQ